MKQKFRTIGEIELAGLGRAVVHAGRYVHGGQIAITLTDAAGFEPIGIFSVNLAANGVSLAKDEFAVKGWSENAPLFAPMLASGLFRDTGRRILTGYVSAPIWRIKDPAHVPPLERARTRDRD